MSAGDTTSWSVGDPLPGWSTVVDAERMKVFSLVTRDPNPIHWDLAEVEALGLGDRAVNQGGLNLAYVIDALAAWPGIRTRLRSVHVRFLGNVFAGDEVRAEGEVTAVTAETADLAVRLIGPTGAPVLSGTATIRRLEEEPR